MRRRFAPSRTMRVVISSFETRAKGALLRMRAKGIG
jgi:hypothetical protein